MSAATKLISASGATGNSELELVGYTTKVGSEQPSFISWYLPSYEVGDLVIVAICTSSTSAPSSQTPSSMSGYTLIRNTFSNDTFEISLSTFYLIGSATSPSSVYATLPTTYTNLHGPLGWAGVYRNVSSSPLLESKFQSAVNGEAPLAFQSLSGSGAPFGAFAIGAASSGGTAGDVSFSTTQSYDEFYNLNNYNVSGISNRCQLGIMKLDHTSSSTLSFTSWTSNASQSDGRRARTGHSFSMEIE